MYNEDWLSRHPGPLQPDDPHNPDKTFDPECGTDLVKNRIGEYSNCIPTSSLPTVAAIQPDLQPRQTRRSPLSKDAQIFVPSRSRRKDPKVGSHESEVQRISPSDARSRSSKQSDRKTRSLISQIEETSGGPPKANGGPPKEFRGKPRSGARPKTTLKAQREAKEALDSPTFEPPYYGRDWPCICGKGCEPAGSETVHGRHG